MTEPVRLRDEGSAFLKKALESARRETPDAERAAALEARILPVLLPPPPLPPTPPPAGAELGAAKAGAGVALAKAGVSAWKASLIGLAATVVVGGGATTYVVTRGDAPAPVAPVSGVVGMTPLPPGATASATQAPMLAPLAPASAASAAPSSPDLGKAKPALSASASASASASRESDLAAEVALLQAAQDGLRGNPTEALARANEHTRRFPRGTLGQEREVIAIEALVKLGRRDEARARAERFSRAYPGSTHQRRIDALLGDK